MSKVKNEASRLKTVLKTSKICLYADEEGDVWNIVLDAIINQNDTKIFEDKEYYTQQNYEYPLVNLEEPDIYFESENFIIGIEHFCVDSSKRTKKGSTYTVDRKKIDKEVEKVHHVSKQEESHLATVINTNLSYDNYANTVITTFNKHAKHVDAYKRNLSSIASNKIVYIVFFIDDVTTTWTGIKNSNGIIEPLNPLCMKEFIQVLKQSKDIDYVIVKNKNVVHILQLKEEYIKLLQKESYDFNKDVFVWNTPEFIYSFYALDDDS